MGPSANSGARGSVSADNLLLQTEAGSARATLAGGRGREGRVGVGVDGDGAALRTSLLLAAGTAAVLVIPVVFHTIAFHAPTARTGLETMMTTFGLAAAWLFRGQFASSRRLGDLLLFGTALMMGLMAFGIGALAAALDLRQSTHFAAAELIGALFIGLILTAAAFAPSDRVVIGARYPVLSMTALSAAGVGVAVLASLLLHGQLVGVPMHDSDADVQVLGHPLGLSLVLSATVLLAFAATGFVRQQRRSTKAPAGLPAVAAMMLAAASFAHLVPASLSPGLIAPGQAFAALGFVVVLAAAVRRDHLLRDRMTNAAALAERRRVAQDLHDGLAQDLALIVVHGETIAQDIGDDHPIVIAARRALKLSRSAIAELSDAPGATPDQALEAVAQEFRDRFDVAIAVEADCDRELAPEAQEHLSRIAREAIANAARHGGAKHVVVSLRGTENGVMLRVVDDGCGMPSAGIGGAHEGFGLRSMRERTDALGGHLTLRPRRKRGTELQVLLP